MGAAVLVVCSVVVFLRVLLPWTYSSNGLTVTSPDLKGIYKETGVRFPQSTRLLQSKSQPTPSQRMVGAEMEIDRRDVSRICVPGVKKITKNDTEQVQSILDQSAGGLHTTWWHPDLTSDFTVITSEYTWAEENRRTRRGISYIVVTHENQPRPTVYLLVCQGSGA